MEGPSSWMLLKACGLIGCREVPFSGLMVALGLVCSHSMLHHSLVLHALPTAWISSDRLNVLRPVVVDMCEGELEAIRKVTLHGFALFLECMCRAVIYQCHILGRGSEPVGFSILTYRCQPDLENIVDTFP